MPQAIITASVLNRARELEVKYLDQHGSNAMQCLGYVIVTYPGNGVNSAEVIAEYVDMPFGDAVQKMALRLAQLESES